MGKPRKTGTYEHFCVLIFAQGTWKETDREEIRNLIKEKLKSIKGANYSIYNKLTYRDQMPNYADCHLCQPIYNMFEEIKGNNDGILYQGHHYLIPEDDLDDMKSLVSLIIAQDKVKKLYLLYIDGFGEVKRTVLNQMDLEEFKEQLAFEKCSIIDFILKLDNSKFENRTVYEISKSRGVTY